MNETTPEVRIVELPPCPFEDFLLHMNENHEGKWTWAFVEMCARFGVFHSTPETTLLARPVSSRLSVDDLTAFNDLDPGHELASDLTLEHDTWHVLYASGDLSAFFDFCPYELPFVSWHRNKGVDVLRRYDFQTIKRRTHGTAKT